MSEEHSSHQDSWIPYHMILRDDQPQHPGWDNVLEARRLRPGEQPQMHSGGAGDEYAYRCKRCHYEPPPLKTWNNWFRYDSSGDIHHECPECHNDPLVAVTVAYANVGQKTEG